VLSAGAIAAAKFMAPAAAQDAERHGMSAFGDLAYPADFSHFKYVNPDAPKGGVFSQIGPNRQFNQSFQTFNSLNSFILKGDAAQGMELTFATLMVRAGDEPDAMYGQPARSLRISDNGLTYRFTLRSEAKFHDGTPLTAHDVVWSLATLKDRGHPIITQLLRDFKGAEAPDDRTVVVRFADKRGRDVPLFVAGLPIFSRAYYSKQPFDQSTLEIPLGSGAYKVGRFEAGHFIEFERVKDWWGADLPVSRGQNNFDVVRFEYYRDREVGFEGFTAKSYLFREEFTSRTWATRYDFPAFKNGRVKRAVLPDDTPSGAQGWFINMRRPQFKDRRLREVLIDAFDFEWTNKNIMYGSYDRTVSVFQNSPMMAQGKPDAAQLALLEPFRGKLPDEVFGEPYVPPVTDGSGQDRRWLRRGAQLLSDAGFVLKGRKRVMPGGKPITIEFLLDEPTFTPHHLPYIKNLATLGIDATLRVVDPVQYRARVDSFDFDITVERFSFSATPGDSLRTYFSSAAAATKGSQNLAGIADPAVDALVDIIIAAKTRAELTTACQALDRVIRAGRYWIPHWYKASHWIAFWDVFGHPAAKPRYFRGIPETWWYDRDKAAKLEQRG
jgi:microcin C transport system substrate-binding protein